MPRMADRPALQRRIQGEGGGGAGGEGGVAGRGGSGSGSGGGAAEGVRFSFNGRTHAGRDGDTVASALAAEGVDILAHSFKYHRPRGLLCVDGRCPNCIVDVDGQPNVRACVTPVTEGMKVRAQNAWPSMRLDLLALTD